MHKPYIEMTLDFFVDRIKKADKTTLAQLEDYVKKIGHNATNKQLRDAISNYNRLNLIDYIAPGLYQLNKDKIVDFYDKFKKGLVVLWCRPDIGQEKRLEPDFATRRNTMMFKARAIIAAHAMPFTSYEVYEIAKKHKIKMNKKAVKNLTAKYNDCFKVIGKVDYFSIYMLSDKFFETFEMEKDIYIDMFPKRKKVIEQLFETRMVRKDSGLIDSAIDFKKLTIETPADQPPANEKPAEAKTIEAKPADETPAEEKAMEAKPADETPADQPPADEKPAEAIEAAGDIDKSAGKMAKKIRSHLVIKAVFAAYQKPLTAPDVEKIALKYGHKVSRAAIIYYVGNKNKQIIKDGKRGRAPLYSPAEKFFEDNAPNIDLFLTILPDKKSNILSRFNMFGGNAPAIEKQEVPADPPAVADENRQLAESHDDDDLNMVDAANVGASILAYVAALQKKIKSKAAIDPGEVDQIRYKYEDSKQTVIGLRSEVQSLNLTIKNLKGIIEKNNQRLIDLNHELSVLKNATQPENKPVRSKFKVSEVARITTIVKRNQAANGQR